MRPRVGIRAMKPQAETRAMKPQAEIRVMKPQAEIRVTRPQAEIRVTRPRAEIGVMRTQAEIKASKPVATSPRAEARKARRRTANNSSVVFSFVPLRNDWPDDSEQFPNGVLKWGRILNEASDPLVSYWAN